jgi:thioesterase domain-containing protein
MGTHDCTVVCVREGGRANSVAFLPGLGALASEMAPLADRIGGTGGVYILDLMALAGAESELPTVESLAERGRSILNNLGGVDAVVGYSFGGLIAVEMARLSGGAGDRPTRSILIDSTPDQSHWPTATWLASVWSRLTGYALAIGKLSPKLAVAEFGRRAKGLTRSIRRRRVVLKRQRATAADLGLDDSANVRLIRAYFLYRPTPYSGSLTLIESADPLFATHASMLWQPLISKLEVLRYPGGHLDALRNEECLQQLAAQLNACLALTT